MIKREINKLKLRIISAGFRQMDVAKEVGISEQRLSAFVRRERKPNEVELTNLAEILQCSQEEILSHWT